MGIDVTELTITIDDKELLSSLCWQIDCVALYLIFLVQMITSGLQVGIVPVSVLTADRCQILKLSVKITPAHLYIPKVQGEAGFVKFCLINLSSFRIFQVM